MQSPQVEVFLTTNRGWGVKAGHPIKKGTFVVEYAGLNLAITLHLMQYVALPDTAC